jgi:hypothetical protein
MVAFMDNTPIFISNFLEDTEFVSLQNYVKSKNKAETRFYDGYNRYEWSGSEVLNNLHQQLLPVAREHFKSETLVPSFNFASWYFGNASLEHHTDINACTYSIDLAVYAEIPWELYVEGVPYDLKENDALLYYGESQEHWREPLVNPENKVVCNVFFFYVEPDHWFITEPVEKHLEIRTQNAVGTVQDRLRREKEQNGS